MLPTNVETFVEGFHTAEGVADMVYTKLANSDTHVSRVALGAAGMGAVYGAVDRNECVATVHEALRCGINLLDTAPWYGQGASESLLGEALREVPRQSYHVATKVGRYQPQYERMFDFSAQRTYDSMSESLQRLGLNSVDIVQIHDVEFAGDMATIVDETLPALADVVESGSASFIGITGYPVSVLMEVVRRSRVNISCVMSYCRNNVHDDTLQQHMDFFRQRNIAVFDASPTSMGLLSPQGAPAWHICSQRLRQTTSILRQHCQLQGHDFSRLCMKYFMQRPGVTSHVTGCVTRQQLRDNVHDWREPITHQEQPLVEHIVRTYSQLPLHERSWEGVEAARYSQPESRRQLQQLLTGQTDETKQ